MNNKSGYRGSFLDGLGIILLSLFIIWQSYGINIARWDGKGISARYFPILLALLMAMLGLLLVIQSFVIDTSLRKSPTFTWLPVAVAGKRFSLPAPLLPIILAIAFLYLIETLGFIITSSLTIVVLLAILRPGRLWQSLAIAIGFSTAVYYIFYYAFQIYLPEGFGL